MRHRMLCLSLPLLVTLLVPQAGSTPADPVTITAGADVHRGYGRLAEAEGEYRRALALDPRSFRARRGLAQVLDLTRRHVEAQREFRAALEVAGQHEDESALRDLAVSFVFERKFDEARKTIETLAALKTSRYGHAGGAPEFLRHLALATGRLDEAETHARRKDQEQRRAAVDATDEKMELLLHAIAGVELGGELAVLAARRGQREAALAHLKELEAAFEPVFSKLPEGLRSVEHIPSYAVPAAEVAFLLGDDRRAIRILTALPASFSRLLPGAMILAQAYERQKDLVNARLQYEHVVNLKFHGLELALARPLAESRLAALGK